MKELEIGAEYQGDCVIWIDGHGYGFLRVAGTRRDVFVHARQLTNATQLQRGDRVAFEVRMNRDGKLYADSCSLLDK